jgi:hypothetical protein
MFTEKIKEKLTSLQKEMAENDAEGKTVYQAINAGNARLLELSQRQMVISGQIEALEELLESAGAKEEAV